MEIRITTAEEGEVRNEEGEEIHYATFSAQQSTNLTANGKRGSFSRSLFGSVCVCVCVGRWADRWGETSLSHYYDVSEH